MSTTVLPVYKGFEIETLLLACQSINGTRAHRGEGYEIAVKIFRAGTTPDGSNSRIFKLTGQAPFTAIGEARRAGNKYGQSIIDGTIKDHSVEDL